MLKNKTAVITGASRGIGRAIALEYAKNGADVAVLYNSGSDAADETVREALQYGNRAIAFSCDVSDFAASEATVE